MENSKVSLNNDRLSKNSDLLHQLIQGNDLGLGIGH